MKQAYTDPEVEELCQIYRLHGLSYQASEIIKFLKEKFGYSDVHNIIVEIRKEFINNRPSKEWEKFHKQFKDSTLQETLIKRLTQEK